MKIEGYIIQIPFPGHAKDIISDGKVFYRGVTVEEYLKDNAGCKSVTPDEYDALHQNHFARPFKEITEQEYTRCLECLPPLKWHTIKGTPFNIFFVGESYSGLLYDICLKHITTGKHYTARLKITMPDADIKAQFITEMNISPADQIATSLQEL